MLCMFLRRVSRCPIVVASEYGGCFLSVSVVSPGNGGRKPWVSALVSVEMAGEKRVACVKSTRSAGVDLLLMAGKAMACSGSLVTHSPCVESSR